VTSTGLFGDGWYLREAITNGRTSDAEQVVRRRTQHYSVAFRILYSAIVVAIIAAHSRMIDCHTLRRTAASSQVCRGVVVHLLSALTIRWLLAVQPSNGRCDYVS
jgi:hypothetical protein